MTMTIPRRMQLHMLTPAEAAIHSAEKAVETAGDDPRLAEAAALLLRARELVGDFVDGGPVAATVKAIGSAGAGGLWPSLQEVRA